MANVTAQPNDDQQKFRQQINQMVNAFNEFHKTIVELKREQQDVVKHIHAQIDQKKIDQIHELLKHI